MNAAENIAQSAKMIFVARQCAASSWRVQDLDVHGLRIFLYIRDVNRKTHKSFPDDACRCRAETDYYLTPSPTSTAC